MTPGSWSNTLTGSVDRPRYAVFSLVLIAGAWLLDAATRQLPFDLMTMASHVVPIIYGSLSFDLQCRRANDSGRGVRYVVMACLALLLAVACFAYGVFGPGSELPHTPVGTASGVLFATIYVGMQIALFLFPSAD